MRDALFICSSTAERYAVSCLDGEKVNAVEFPVIIGVDVQYFHKCLLDTGPSLELDTTSMVPRLVKPNNDLELDTTTTVPPLAKPNKDSALDTTTMVLPLAKSNEAIEFQELGTTSIVPPLAKPNKDSALDTT